MKWPQYNETDLEIFLSYLRTEMKADEKIVRIKIENKRATDMRIAIEPQGSGDTFPAGSIYEVATIGKPEIPAIHIQILDNNVFVYCEYGDGAIFDNGTVTLAY